MNYLRTMGSELSKHLFFEMIAANWPIRPYWGAVALLAFVALLAYPLLGFALEVAVFLLLLFGAFLVIRNGVRKSRYRKDIKESNKEVQISETRVSDPPQIRR